MTTAPRVPTVYDLIGAVLPIGRTVVQGAEGRPIGHPANFYHSGIGFEVFIPKMH
jgi:hypothetical protein